MSSYACVQVGAWLKASEATLDFLFRPDTPELGVAEALQGPPQVTGSTGVTTPCSSRSVIP